MLTSERIAEIQSRSRADYACLDAPGFRDSLAARRDVAALLEDRAELVAENERLREQTQQWVKDWEVECQRYEAALGIATSEHVALKAEIERLREALKAGQVGHIIEFRDNGWTIQHPLSCRPNLFECEVSRAAERDVDGVPPEGVGRYVCGAEEGGRFWYDGASNAALEGEG